MRRRPALIPHQLARRREGELRDRREPWQGIGRKFEDPLNARRSSRARAFGSVWFETLTPHAPPVWSCPYVGLSANPVARLPQEAWQYQQAVAPKVGVFV